MGGSLSENHLHSSWVNSLEGNQQKCGYNPEQDKCYRMSYRCVSNCATLGISHVQTHTHAQTNHFLLGGRDLTGEVPMNPKVFFPYHCVIYLGVVVTNVI